MPPPSRPGPNEHIWIGTKIDVPATISLVSERLTDGSTVWNIEIRDFTIACRTETQGRDAMAGIAAMLRALLERDQVLHL